MRLTYRFDPTARARGHRPHFFEQPTHDWEQAVQIERWCFLEFGRQDQKRGIEWHIRRRHWTEEDSGDTFEIGNDRAAMAFRLRWC